MTVAAAGSLERVLTWLRVEPTIDEVVAAFIDIDEASARGLIAAGTRRREQLGEFRIDGVREVFSGAVADLTASDDSRWRVGVTASSKEPDARIAGLWVAPRPQKVPTEETVRSERMLLRRFVEQDLELLQPIFDEPGLLQHVWAGGAILSPEAHVTGADQQWERNGYGGWAIEDPVGRDLVGFAGINEIRPDDDAVQFVAVVRRAYQRRGIATEVAKAAVRWAFREFDFPRILLLADPRNEASLQAIAQQGVALSGAVRLAGQNYTTFVITPSEFV